MTHCGIYSLCRSKVYDDNSTNGVTEIHYCEILICEVAYHLKVDCDKLKMYMVNAKAAVIANKLTKIKCNHKIFNPKEGRKIWKSE